MSNELNASQGTVDGKKEKLVEDLKGVVADAGGLLMEVSNSTAEGFAAAGTKIEGKLAEARSRFGDARIALTEKAKGAADATHEYVRENPWKVIGVAAAAGLIVGTVLSRR